MADTLTTTTQVDPAVDTYYNRVLLKEATAGLTFLNWAQHAVIPKKSGGQAKWRRYANMSPATTPLAEGVNPPGQQLSKTDLTARLSMYGDYLHITDEVDFTVQDPVLTVAAEKLGEQESDTLDVLMRDILVACASATNASGGSNGGTPTEITAGDVNAVVKTLLGGDAKPVSKQIKAGTGQGTEPIRAAFMAVIHTDLIDDLEDCTGFLSVAEYPSPKDVKDTEWGSVTNVRFHQTTNGAKSSDATPVYSVPIIGQDAYGDVEISGSNQNIRHAFGSAGVADALNRTASSGWKVMWAGRILNDAFMHVLKVTHTA